MLSSRFPFPEQNIEIRPIVTFMSFWLDQSFLSRSLLRSNNCCSSHVTVITSTKITYVTNTKEDEYKLTVVYK